MAEPFGLHGKITATQGNGDALAALLLEAAAGLESVPDCQLYLVSRDPAEPEAIWVTEVWTDREAHAASLQLKAVRDSQYMTTWQEISALHLPQDSNIQVKKLAGQISGCDDRPGIGPRPGQCRIRPDPGH